MLDRFRDLVREGASEVFGFGDELAGLREANADARLLARKVEDLTFGDLLNNAQHSDFLVTRADHRDMVLKAYRYYFGDPVVRRTVDLRTFYTFGSGIPRPRYRDDEDDTSDDAEARRGQQVIDALWTDPENKATITGTMAQRQKSLELQAQGNVFLVLFETDTPLSSRDEPAANLKIADLPEREIVQIVTHPRNRKLPIYYRREFTPLRFSVQSGMYEPGETQILYYRDWQHDAPADGEEFNGQVWENPPPEQIAEGRVYHIKVNATSDMLFGVSEMHSITRWARALNEFMTARTSVVQAIAQMAMQLKVRGNQRSVQQMQGRLQELHTLARKVDGTAEGLGMERATGAATRVGVTNESADLQPMIPDTNAQSAMTDVQTIKGQVAAGSGIPVHHLGDVGSANLASSVSMDGPLLRMIRADQQVWKDVHTDLNRYALRIAGLDPDRLEVTMPPITDRDATEVASMFGGLLTAIAQGQPDRDMVRFVFGEVLDAMGKQNADRVLNELFPEGWQPPEPPAAAPPAGDGVAGLRDTAQQAERDDRQGRRRNADERGGTARAQAQSRQRAEQRASAAREATLDDPDIGDFITEAMAELDALVGEPLVGA